jgi:hypothetical protein
MKIASYMLLIFLCSTVIADEIVATNKYDNSTQAFFIMNDRPAMIIGYRCEVKLCLYSVRTIDADNNLVFISDVREYELYLPSDHSIVINP